MEPVNAAMELDQQSKVKLYAPPVWRDLLLLLAACAALWGWTYGGWDLWGPDEPRYVQIARELLGRANWLILTVLGESYDQKPPLPYWMMAGMLKISGGVVSSWAVRLPSVLFGVMSVLLTYRIGRARLGRRAGWLAAWMLLTAPLFIEEAPTARLDMLLTGFTVLALWAWLGLAEDRQTMSPGRCVVFWIGVTGAFFIKGPVAWAVILGTVAFEAWRARSWRPLTGLRPQWGAPAMLALIIAWLVALGFLVSWHYVDAMFLTATVERVHDPTMHRKGPFYYLGAILGEGFMPWTLLLLPALAGLWRTRRALPAEWPRLRPILLWALWPFLFFSIVPTKREQYLLPILPAMALVAGWFLDRHFDLTVPAWGRRLGAALAAAVGLALAGLAAVMLAGVFPMAARHPDLMEEWSLIRAAHGLAARMGMVGLAGALLGASALLWPRAATLGQAARLLCGSVFFGAVIALGCGAPLMNAIKSPRAINRAIQARLLQPDEKVGALGSTYKAQYVVYSTHRLIDLETNPEILAASASALPRLIIGNADDKKWGKIEPVLIGLGYRPVYRATASHDHLTLYVRGGA